MAGDADIEPILQFFEYAHLPPRLAGGQPVVWCAGAGDCKQFTEQPGAHGCIAQAAGG